MSNTSRKHAASTYGVCAVSGTLYLVTLLTPWQLVWLAIVWSTDMHCYMVPLRCRSTICRVQNKLARDVCKVIKRQQHTVYLIRNLHWHPIRIRITLKVATLCYKAYRLNQPRYYIEAIFATSWTKICRDGSFDSTKVAYQNSGTSFLFCGRQVVLQSIPAQSTKLAVRHIEGISAMLRITSAEMDLLIVPRSCTKTVARRFSSRSLKRTSTSHS